MSFTQCSVHCFSSSTCIHVKHLHTVCSLFFLVYAYQSQYWIFKRKCRNGAVNTVMQDCAASRNNIHEVLVFVNAAGKGFSQFAVAYGWKNLHRKTTLDTMLPSRRPTSVWLGQEKDLFPPHSDHLRALLTNRFAQVESKKSNMLRP